MERLSRTHALKKAQAVLARYVDPGTLVSEELIAERKEEACSARSDGGSKSREAKSWMDSTLMSALSGSP